MKKRVFDIVVSGFALVILAPLMLVIAIGLLLTNGSPVFYRQTRPGLKAKPFTLVKFRTMHEGPGSDAARLSRLGRFLRTTSLDELPELVNVIRGEMSLVGPRPLLVEYLPLYSEHQARRHEVRPGITGWAQVNGRNAISWQSRFDLDVWYVDNQSFWLDMKILGKTLVGVVHREGISYPGEATMKKFTGND